LRRLTKDHETLIPHPVTSSNSAKIRNGHLSNTSSERCRHTSPINPSTAQPSCQCVPAYSFCLLYACALGENLNLIEAIPMCLGTIKIW